MTTLDIVFLAALIGLIPAAIAHAKGESFAAWWIFGAILFIVALPAALFLEPRPEGWQDPASPGALWRRRRELRDDSSRRREGDETR
ncbi:MAG: hypothetical protein ABR592_04535 [Nitriliruptorales bacterium]